jgi:hypothetical protein
METSGRTVDIELGGQEVITIELDNLDPNPDDVLDLLKEGQCKVWVWAKLAAEYWRRGYLEAAERIARAAIECTSSVLARRLLFSNQLEQHPKEADLGPPYCPYILFSPIYRVRTREQHPKLYYQMPVG